MEDDWSGLKVGTLAHDWHPEEASHRSDEPVSNTTLKVCGGVPMEIPPMYDESAC